MRRFNILFPLLFVLSEAIIITFVSSLMHYITFSSWSFYNSLIVIFWVITVLYTKSYNMGRGVSYINTITLALKSIFILFSVVAIGNLFVDYYTFSIKSIFFALSIFTFSVLSFRIITHFILDSYRSYGGNITNVAIFGYDKMGKNFYRTLKQYPHLGYRADGIFSFKTKKNKIHDIPNLGSFNTFFNNYTKYQEIFISTNISIKVQKELIEFCDKKFIPVKLLPELVNYEFKNFFIKKFYNIPVIDVNLLPLDLWYNQLVKRIFDIIFSTFVLIFFVSWMYVIFGLIIKIQSKGPIIFKQRRHGVEGNIFNCYKFRTMILNDQEDTKFADNNDIRLTKFGKFLRI